jgi:hypothetical protein
LRTFNYLYVFHGRATMKKILFGATALLLLVAGPASADDNTPWLGSDITYKFAIFQGHSNSSFVPAWPLAWEGTIQGDVNGVIRWWIDPVETVYPVYVGRWEVLDCDPVYPIACPLDAPVIMAGYSAGTNVAPIDGIAAWSGKGVVTIVNDDAYPQYAKWFGRRTIEGGWYDFAEVFGDLYPNYGEGTFMILHRPSNKH